MLSTDQLKDLDAAQRDLTDKKLILDIGSDIQTLLQILVEKEIITREEVATKREIVRGSQKYRNAYLFIEQTAAEIVKYKNDPQALLREMFNRKMK